MREAVKKIIPKRVFKQIEPYGHWAEAALMNARHRFPARGLKVIGVTGTDGKSTTSTLIYTMLKEAGYKVGLLTTINIDLGKGLKPNSTRLTTMKSGEVFKSLKQMKKNKVQWLVLEVTSHALAQRRVWGVPFAIGVMTNITHEHLDYHGTFEHYRDSKLRLFKLVGKNDEGLRAGVVNADDESAERFALAVRRAIRYGVEHGDLRAEDIKSTATGNSFVARYYNQKLKINSHLPGSFNVYNCLATVGVGLVLDMTPSQIERGIAALETVEGRMNSIDEGQDFAVIVDYAHTPESFEKVFNELKPVTKGRLIAVFGSAGRRDELKRPRQGEIAGKCCDLVVVTEEDDRDVDGTQILNEIAAGAEKAGKERNKDLFLIHNRAEAIDFAIKQAKPGDTVMLLGKGHESSIESGDGKHHWDEAGTARGALKARLKK